MMKITFLGTGTSYGVPRIGCRCETCQSTDPRDRRFRSSIVVEKRGRRLLIDTTPDLRSQLLAADISNLDVVALTHFHSDHVMGIDDLRAITDARTTPLPVLAPEGDCEQLTVSFPHLFGPHRRPGYSAELRLEAFNSGETREIEGMNIQGWLVPHGGGSTMGYVVDQSIAYFTDLSEMSDQTVAQIQGVSVLVLDMLREAPHPTHLNLEQSLELARRIGAKSTYFIHMSHEVRHARVESRLPPTHRLAFDGLVVNVD